MKLRRALAFAVCALGLVLTAARPAAAQSPPPELGQGWLPEFTLATRHILALAEATPEEKFAWRPAPGIRSISEVYVHTAMANLFLLERAGVKPSGDLSIPKEPETTITTNADVIAWLKKSFDAVRQGFESADRSQKVKLFNRETTAEGVFLRILLHIHEHMGQAVAYARMNGIAPPWSGGD